ncbi:MAG: hypothetical protein HY071_05555 [Chloroflexi bacterium]|nr:hypothetical protein [Chloroflexota bacterium]
MAWRKERWQVEHALPIGASERAIVGDTVVAGDVIAAGTSIGSVTTVSGARHVGVAPDDLDEVTRVAVGAAVEKGAVLARTGRHIARVALAPFSGRLVHRTAEGDFVIAPIVERWSVRSTMDGTVIRSDGAAVVVEGVAWALPGIAGYGPDAIGEIAMGVDAPVDELAPTRIDVRLRDKILIGGARMAAEAVTRAHACGVSGLVAGAAPAGGLRVVYGEDVTAGGLPGRDDRPTVLCLIGFGSAALPREIFLPLVAFSGARAAIHTASARLFVFSDATLDDVSTEMPALALANDYGGVRPVDASELAGPTTFPSEVRVAAFATEEGAVPLPNVLPYDAPR